MRILIIDDDVQIREGITEGIDWASLGIAEVRNCGDGAAGLAIYEEFRPDIILADVRMPEMDGLEFLQRVREMDESVKVIMISGYSDFEYLKKAIKYGAEDYELKPIKVKNLIQLISRTKQKIIRERFSKAKVEEYQSAYEKNFIREVLGGEVVDPNVITGFLQNGFRNGDTRTVICGALTADPLADRNDYGELDREVLQFMDSLDEDICCFRVREGHYLLLMPAQPSTLYVFNQQNKMKSYYEKMKQCAWYQEIGMSISLGISLEVPLSQVKKGYDLACEWLEYRICDGRESVHTQTGIPGKGGITERSREFPGKGGITERSREFPGKGGITERSREFPGKGGITEKSGELSGLAAELTEAFLAKSESRIEEVLEQAGNIMRRERIKDLNIVLEFILDSCIEVNNYYIKNGYRKKPFHTITVQGRLDQYYFLEEYLAFAKKLFREALIQEKQVIWNKYSGTIAKAVHHIEKHYMENLTADYMGELIEKTPNYFSHLFKKEVGVSFKEYLNRVRMEKAKILLLETDLKIYEVAEKVGFHDSIYFSQAFKKCMGCSPAECKKG